MTESDICRPWGVLWRVAGQTILFPLLSLAQLALGSAVPARGESLKAALAATYLANPELNAQRASLRATNETVARAKSGFRPTITGEASFYSQDLRIATDFFALSGHTHSQSYSINLIQPIFRGFRTINAIRGAESLVNAGREDLRMVEQQVLLSAVQAYADVVRDLSVVKLSESNVKVLSEQYDSAEGYYNTGQLTKTDVYQALAALANAQSGLSGAKTKLQISRANFQRIVGYAPGMVSAPAPIDELLPSSLADALEVGEAENPAILAMLHRERAQDHAIEEARGELLPQVGLLASYNKIFNPLPGLDSLEKGIVGVKMTIPLYQGGEVGARIRQNVELRAQVRAQLTATRLEVRSNVFSAWSQLAAVKTQITSHQSQVNANASALEGVKLEQKVGQRTVLDTLNAQLALLNSRVQLETAKRERVTASFALLAAIGRLNARGLSLPVATYDPSAHYNNVKDKAFDWDWLTEKAQ